jgi:hypothetical protein
MTSQLTKEEQKKAFFEEGLHKLELVLQVTASQSKHQEYCFTLGPSAAKQLLESRSLKFNSSDPRCTSGNQ